MTSYKYADMLAPQEREMGFFLIYLPAMVYLMHDGTVVRRWLERDFQKVELADAIQELTASPQRPAS